MNKITKLGVALAVSFMFVFSPVMAVQKIMRIATWIPAMHPQNSIVFPKYKEWIEQATEGRVSLKLEYGLGSPVAMYDLVEDGVVDASYSANGYIPGRFDTYTFFELPLGREVDLEKASVAMYKTLDKFYKNDGEFPGWEGLHVAGTWFYPAPQMTTTKPIKSLAELKGLKVVTGDRIRGDFAVEYGMIPVSILAPKIYEGFQQGMIDAVTFSYEAQESFRMKEVAPYIMVLNMNIRHFTFVISNDFLNSLSEKDRNAIKALSGEKFSALAGSMWADATEQVRKTLPADKIFKSDAVIAEYQAFAKKYNEKRLAEFEKTDPNVRKAYAYYLSLID